MFSQFILLAAFLAAYRIFVILPKSSQKPTRRQIGKIDSRVVAVFLGSGTYFLFVQFLTL